VRPRRRTRRLSDPLPTCPAGCGARVLHVRTEDGTDDVVDYWRRPDGDETPALAVRRTGATSGFARSVGHPGARPLEPNERMHRVHAKACPRQETHAHRQAVQRARAGSAAAADVVDVTEPRRADA
jgi:hypothetical protein